MISKAHHKVVCIKTSTCPYMGSYIKSLQILMTIFHAKDRQVVEIAKKIALIKFILNWYTKLKHNWTKLSRFIFMFAIHHLLRIIHSLLGLFIDCVSFLWCLVFFSTFMIYTTLSFILLTSRYFIPFSKMALCSIVFFCSIEIF